MTKPRVRKKRTEQTISATDEEWDDVRSGAKKAGESVSAWAVHCALTVDPLPRKHRRLALDEKEQRSMPRAVGEHVRRARSSSRRGRYAAAADHPSAARAPVRPPV